MIAILTLSALLVPMVAANRDVGAQTSSQGAAPAGQAAEDQDKTPFIGVMIVTLQPTRPPRWAWRAASRS